MERPSKTVDRLERLEQVREERSHVPPYRPESLLLGASTPCLIEGVHTTSYPGFYLHDHMEDRRKWDGKFTSAQATRVCELRAGMTTTGNSSRVNATPVSSGQVLRQEGAGRE